MSNPEVAIKELVARARSGQQTALAELLDALAEEMQHAAEVEVKALNSPRHPQAVWAKVKHDAQLHFADFQGDTAADVRDWLRGIVLRELRLTRQGQHGGANIETIGPRSSRGAELDTISPTSPIKLPATGPLTVHQSSDKTHVLNPPAGETSGGKDPASSSSSPPPQREPEADSTSTGDSDQLDEEASRAETQKRDLDPHATVTDLSVTVPPEIPITLPAPAPALDIESFEDYEILSEIARGGMGVVYKVRDRKLNRKVGLKMILAGQLANPEDIERFYIEAQAAAILRHKNIVGIHQVGEHDGRHYFSMDYIEGKSLADMITDGPLNPRDAARYLRKVAAAIQYAHDLDVLHRDLKPSNVLVDQRDEPLVTDFGLAKRTRQDDPVATDASGPSRQEGGSMVTMAGAIMGTPGYMPPEQAAGEVDNISARSDVYSLGATLYDLITGRPPIVGKDAWDTVKKVQQEDPVPPRDLNPRISLDLNAICLKCLARDPQSRYATAQELADDLQRYSSDMPVRARPASRSEHALRWCRRNPRVASLAALSVLLFVTAFVGISLGYVWTRAALADARASLDQMRQAIDTLYTEVSDTEALNQPGLKPFRRKLLSRARQLYDQALERLGDDPALRKDLAGSHFTLARILLELESPNETLDTLETAETMVSQLLADDPQDAELVELAGRVMNLKGEVLRDTGRLQESLEAFEKAIEYRLGLVSLMPREYEYKRQLINSQMNLGLIHKTMFVDPNDMSHYDEATERLKKSQDDRDALAVDFPDVAPKDARVRFDSAQGAYNLADLKTLRVDQLWNESVDIEKRNESDNPAGRAETPFDELQKQITEIDEEIVVLESESLTLLETSFDELDSLLGGKATELQGIEKLDAFRTRFLRALCLMLSGRLTADVVTATESHQEADEILTQLLQDNPTVHKYRATRAGNYMLIANCQDASEALKSYDRAVGDFKELVKQFPGVAFYAKNLAAAEVARSVLQHQLERPNQETQ